MPCTCYEAMKDLSRVGWTVSVRPRGDKPHDLRATERFVCIFCDTAYGLTPAPLGLVAFPADRLTFA